MLISQKKAHVQITYLPTDQNVSDFQYLIERTKDQKLRMLDKMRSLKHTQNVKGRVINKNELLKQYYMPMDGYEFALIDVLGYRIQRRLDVWYLPNQSATIDYLKC